MDAFDAALGRRRPSRTAAGFTAMGLCGLGVLVVVLATGGPVPLALAATLAVAPVPLLVVVVLALDRLEPEPMRNLVTAFLWGATVAAIVAGIVNTIGISAVSVLLGALGGTAAYVTLGAPVVEETLKALVLVGFLRYRGHELDGPTDGIVYACMAGLGFALSENLLYYTAALLEGGTGVLAFTFVLRGVLAPLLHPLFTSMTGMALGWAALRRGGAARVLVPIAGLCAAIGLHALWNGSVSIGGPLALALVYLLVMLPAIVMVVLVAWADRGRVARLIRRLLPQVTPEGLVTEHDLQMLSSLKRRRAACTDARRTHGRQAADAMRTYQRAATELALAYDRLERGVADELWVRRRREALLPLMAKPAVRAAPRTTGRASWAAQPPNGQ
ncbi:MAG: PrsW family intramembrane metalloprotease [Egibacteraceae bacterium]